MESYNKLKEIGKGSYGVVWLVKNIKDRKNVKKIISVFKKIYIFFYNLKVCS